MSRNPLTRCPICNRALEHLGQVVGLYGVAVRCATHGEFEVTDSLLHEEHDAQAWERALKVAQSRAAASGGRPRIFTYDFFF